MKSKIFTSDPDLQEVVIRLIKDSECPQVDLINWVYEALNPEQRIIRAQTAISGWEAMLRRRQKHTLHKEWTADGMRCQLTWPDYRADLGDIIDAAEREQQQEPEAVPSITGDSIPAPSSTCAVPTAAPLAPVGWRSASDGTSKRAGVGVRGSSYPLEHDYTAVVVWLEQEKAEGTDWYTLAGCNRSRMCRQLSDLFDWMVSENSLRKAIARA